MKLSIGYPSMADEAIMVENYLIDKRLKTLEPVVNANTILTMQKEVRAIKVHSDLITYMIKIIDATRHNKNIILGASPRATIALTRTVQAVA
jgi:MoxR-like ATPase